MKVKEVREWLHKKCEGISIMWKMNHEGRTDPQHRDRYLIEGNIQKDLTDSDFFPFLTKKIILEINEKGETKWVD